MNLLLVGLLVLIAIAVGWVLGLTSAHYFLKAASRKRLRTLDGVPKSESGLHPQVDGPSESPNSSALPTANSLPVETPVKNGAALPETRQLDDDLKNLIVSAQSDETKIKSRKRGDGRIRHLLVTRYGERWIVDQLPRDDYAESADSSPQSVDQLISKPVGYRLIKGYNLLEGDDTDPEQDS